MLGLPELDTIVCKQLRRQDLAQCARVSKKWHAVVIPHLWGDLTYLRSLSHSQKHAFRNMIQEDLRLQGDDHDMEQDILASLSPSSALSNYGTWIQELPSLEDLESILLLPTPAGQDDLVVADELLLHFLKRCSPAVRIACMSTDLNTYLTSDYFRRAIIDFTLPRLHHLHIRVTFQSPHPELSEMMNLLDRCSVILKRLELSVNVEDSGGDDDGHGGEEQTMDEHNDWISLKELTLHSFTVSTDIREFWSWIFRRCGQVEKLEVRRTHGAAQVLTDMLTHMPKLREVALGVQDARTFIDEDPEVGSLRPWNCEESLRSLKVAIVGIPRPDQKRQPKKNRRSFIHWNNSPGLDIQNQVYDRLARLTNLETLWLEGADRPEGLEMSLASGLAKLSGLKSLKQLYVVGSETRIGVKEARWMVENWPRLCVVRGLESNREAARWLRKNHTQISISV
ncbi:MAG: hypothetical protein J3Q66DRAFT_351590 [Benniella sp.]|nr:MAG: hypothetical protein J3Q66DRAFT_351590 [Benniella sp.]